MTKRDLVVRIAGETGLTQREVYAVVQKTLDHITEALGRQEHIELREFGSFDVVVRKTRIGRNPNRPEHVVRIPERRVVKFKAGRTMKQAVRGPGAPKSLPVDS